MKRKTSVRSYERKDGTPVRSHDRTIDASDLPKVNAESYVPPYRVGDRVEVHPITDEWMMGDMYGEVVVVFDDSIRVKLDKSRRIVEFPLDRIRRKVKDVKMDGNVSPFDAYPRVKVDMSVVREYDNMPPYLSKVRKIVKSSEGKPYLINAYGGTAYINDTPFDLFKVGVPPGALRLHKEGSVFTMKEILSGDTSR